MTVPDAPGPAPGPDGAPRVPRGPARAAAPGRPKEIRLNPFVGILIGFVFPVALSFGMLATFGASVLPGDWGMGPHGLVQLAVAATLAVLAWRRGLETMAVALCLTSSLLFLLMFVLCGPIGLSIDA